MMTVLTKSKTIVPALLATVMQGVFAAGVGFDPSTSTALVGQTFTIAVNGTAFASNLDGGGIDLSFDPAVVEVLTVAIDATQWDFATSLGTIDNSLTTGGKVIGTTFNQFAHPQMGNFHILEYTFRARNRGTTNLVLSEFAGNPFGSGGSHVPVTFSPGMITVVPEPRMISLLGLGLAMGLGMFVRRR